MTRGSDLQIRRTGVGVPEAERSVSGLPFSFSRKDLSSRLEQRPLKLDRKLQEEGDNGRPDPRVTRVLSGERGDEGSPSYPDPSPILVSLRGSSLGLEQ